MIKKIILLYALLCAFAQGAWAQDGWVGVTNESDLNTAVADGALIRLTNDITLSAYLSIGNGVSQTVTLDLNGYTLRRNLDAVDANGHVIEVHSQGTLTIVDNYGGGTISGGWANNGGGICNYGSLHFQGGTITACAANGDGSATGGGIKNGGTMTMSGGTILGCWGKDGGGIYNASGCSLTITGGTITGNTSNAGGGGVVNYGTATITGGTINGNHATTRGGGIWNGGTISLSGVTVSSNRADIDGGGIYISTGGTATLGDGTTITGNTCETNGGGIWSDGTLNMSGTVTVRDNARPSGLASNVYLKSGHVIGVTGGMGSSQIGVSVEQIAGVFTSGYSTNIGGNNVATHFINDRSAISNFSLEDGEAKVNLTTADNVYYVEREWDNTNQKVIETLTFHSMSNLEVLPGTSATRTLHDGWYLISNNNVNYHTLYVDDNEHVRIIVCDGAKLTVTSGIHVKGTLTIYGQIEETGIIETHGSGESPGIGIANHSYGIVNIHGGTVNSYGGTYSAGIGGGKHYYGITVNIYGGNVTATGGSGGAGIGSGYVTYGYNVNGGITTIYGGTVRATGGTDGAGIGSGKYDADQNNYDVTSGSCTILGGHVIAQGNGEAAGIGAGKGGKMGSVSITGGRVEIHSGSSNASWVYAIAATDYGVEDHITLGDDMRVSSGDRLFTYPERKHAVTNWKDVVVEPCVHNDVLHTYGSGCIDVACRSCAYRTTMPYTFQHAGSWTTASSWCANLMPSTGNNVVVKARATIPDGTSVNVGTIDMQAGGGITLEDGAQLKATNSVPVTVQKLFNPACWQAIATPVVNTNNSEFRIHNSELLSTGYDLFRYDEAQGKWENQKAGDVAAGFNTLESGRGYIYRRARSIDVDYHGNTVVDNVDFALSSSCADAALAGFNLVGNPYSHNLPFSRDHYSLNPDGSWTARTDGTGILEVGQAVLVYTANGETLTLSPIGIVSGAKGSLPPLPKGLHLNDGSTGSPQDNEDSQFSTLNSQFAHWDGDRLVITGEGTLQAFDVIGRELFREKVSTYQHINVSTFPQAGVYVLRLNGQSQKIVIK